MFPKVKSKDFYRRRPATGRPSRSFAQREWRRGAGGARPAKKYKYLSLLLLFRWSKTCSFPKTIRAKVLAEVLENTMEEENLVEVVRQLFLCFQQWFLNSMLTSHDFFVRTQNQRQHPKAKWMIMNQRISQGSKRREWSRWTIQTRF